MGLHLSSQKSFGAKALYSALMGGHAHADSFEYLGLENNPIEKLCNRWTGDLHSLVCSVPMSRADVWFECGVLECVSDRVH